ncbi:alcohol dehydrogenase catalytic domain-containing protein [Flavimobilis sp. GY10621]|uniref:Alcohol dehydrogenase catalytic domain-containing protein n=1 Tax=Flavimobilis rhizosphaerae TaxID=2775421 RepID=A0ABR9DN92_9MICO|nr:alcohol dehydrogenase catalytic domain-containing protein [Flavimobilis rhizosphaerae]MBD9698588.1 alcohol dehydrogenase catalytic domain-containing protein [Flavimobilis rhizosphaerae]
MSTMRAAVWTATDTAEVREIPRPEVPEGWALVKMAYNGICGTDLAIYHGKHPRAQHGLVPGHEMSGWIVEPGGSGLAEGTLVVVEPLISCGDCRACRTGAAHVCNRLGLYGIDTPGGMAEYVALPPHTLHAVPGGVDARLAALVEPLAVAVHAVALSGMEQGDTVAVFGAGPIGVLTALVARAEGAGRVVITEPSPWRRSVAESFGLDVVPEGSTMTATLHALTGGEGADTTFDSAAHPSVAAELTDATRVLGRIVIVGVYKEPTALNLRDVCFKEQSMVGVRVYTTADVTRAIELLASGVLGLEKFPTVAYDLADVSAAFDAATSGADALKVLVTPLKDGADR